MQKKRQCPQSVQHVDCRLEPTETHQHVDCRLEPYRKANAGIGSVGDICGLAGIKSEPRFHSIFSDWNRIDPQDTSWHGFSVSVPWVRGDFVDVVFCNGNAVSYRGGLEL